MALWEQYMGWNSKNTKFIDKESGKTKEIEQDALKSAQWISPTLLKLPDGRIVTSDENEVGFEVYNRMKHKVIFENVHPERRDWQFVEVQAESHGFVPHSYVVPWLGYIGNNSKEPINMVKITGKSKFKGIKSPSKNLKA